MIFSSKGHEGQHTNNFQYYTWWKDPNQRDGHKKRMRMYWMATNSQRKNWSWQDSDTFDRERHLTDLNLKMEGNNGGKIQGGIVKKGLRMEACKI